MRRGVYSKKSFYRIQGAISLLRFLLNTVPYTVSTVGTVSALQYACHIDPHLAEYVHNSTYSTVPDHPI